MPPESTDPSEPVDAEPRGGGTASADWPAFSSDWFKDAFQDDYRLLYAARTARQARIEVERVTRELEISAEDRILDLCCGHGRHLEAFWRLGLRATGVDLSLRLLTAIGRDVARTESAARPPRPALARADMRALPFFECFDVVVNFFTSFGYFEVEEDHAVAAREMAGALRPGGRFSMDLMNPDVAIRSLNPRSERRVAPFDVVERRRFDARTRRIEKHTRLLYRPDGQPDERVPQDGSPEHADATNRGRSYHESVRIFTRSEIAALLHHAGLEVERTLGDFSGAPYDADSPRLIVLGRKVAG